MSKTITVGSWDGEEKTVQVEETATVNDVLRAAGITIAASQSVTAFSNAENVRLADRANDGETYLLTNNQESGI